MRIIKFAIAFLSLHFRYYVCTRGIKFARALLSLHALYQVCTRIAIINFACSLSSLHAY